MTTLTTEQRLAVDVLVTRDQISRAAAVNTVRELDESQIRFLLMRIRAPEEEESEEDTTEE